MRKKFFRESNVTSTKKTITFGAVARKIVLMNGEGALNYRIETAKDQVNKT